MVLNWIESYWDALVMMTAEMAPYLLLGFFIAGLLHTFVPRTLYSKHLAPRNMKSVVKAAAIGIPLPLCSCGVIPTTVSLRKEGASHGACTSFLIATPQTGVDSIAATYSLMGLPFAVIRPLAALFTAMFGGWLVNRFGRPMPERPTPDPSREGGETCGEKHCCCHHEEEEHEEHCCCHEHEEPAPLPHGRGWGEGLRQALDYAFVDMMQDVGKWLVVGLLIAALITVAVPSEWLAALHDYKLLNMLIVLAVAIPMYVCATGSIPIAVSLMAKGLTPGAALVLLMAGPAVNSASILVIGKVFGKRTLWLYLLSIIVGAILFGLGIDYLLPQDWFAVQAGFANDEHCAHGLSVMDWVWVAALVLLLINAFWQMHRHGHSCECCHDHAHSLEVHEHEAHCTEHQSHEHTAHEHASAEVTRYSISGMSCNHCKANVERAIRGVEGVEDVYVNLATGIATVTGHHDPEQVLRRVDEFGYSATIIREN